MEKMKMMITMMNIVIDNDWWQGPWRLMILKIWWRSNDALAVIVNDAAPWLKCSLWLKIVTRTITFSWYKLWSSKSRFVMDSQLEDPLMRTISNLPERFCFPSWSSMLKVKSPSWSLSVALNSAASTLTVF